MRRGVLTARRPRNLGAVIEMAPLIDMVFILLIFYIVSTSFVQDAGVGGSTTGWGSFLGGREAGRGSGCTGSGSGLAACEGSAGGLMTRSGWDGARARVQASARPMNWASSTTDMPKANIKATTHKANNTTAAPQPPTAFNNKLSSHSPTRPPKTRARASSAMPRTKRSAAALAAPGRGTGNISST